VAHKLTGRVGQIGATAVSSKFHAIENKIVQGKPADSLVDEIAVATKDLERLLESVRANIMQSSNSGS
jgi:hypothetical protein